MAASALTGNKRAILLSAVTRSATMSQFQVATSPAARVRRRVSSFCLLAVRSSEMPDRAITLPAPSLAQVPRMCAQCSEPSGQRTRMSISKSPALAMAACTTACQCCRSPSSMAPVSCA
ncbi:hypothetical protein D3C81_1336580 [compost metagenome]